ncbi:malonyl-ACP O-methyltransferase BioC [Paenibacillus arenilitoris]|uniref:Malonyl-[acyl-carrier protein] O-methyltransferase n=1 Tax=Paenibacillus arenilitoris TaxID=2772299 RepID=A0A927CN96_9BACL|nr:malonyl-ACP O-methyltransferase BioC [Paenibacillus arenilitoris]MBD2869992.1 malonyl-ACP O-methyltransferase BioC [Paenibacillus arenilitoris]
MSGSLNAISRRFERSAAGAYDANAGVQREMAGRLAGLCADNRDDGGGRPARILEIGCGTGAFTEKLTAAWPNAQLTALDVAPAMLEAANRRLSSSGSAGSEAVGRNISFVRADAETWVSDAAPASFDLIASNACFQWFSRPRQTLHELRRLLRPGGSLAFATFGPLTFRELHHSFEAAYAKRGLASQRHGLTFCEPGLWEAMLADAGFGRPQLARRIQLEKYPTVRDFLHSVKATGASASQASASAAHGLKRLFADMTRSYESQYGSPSGICATYDIILVRAAVPR